MIKIADWYERESRVIRALENAAVVVGHPDDEHVWMLVLRDRPEIRFCPDSRIPEGTGYALDRSAFDVVFYGGGGSGSRA